MKNKVNKWILDNTLIHDIIKMLKINRRELDGNTKFETAYPGLKQKIDIFL